MKLEKLTLENFRQFYGHQEIIFSGYNDRNVTVIHAENGFGKTTLLNAFLWVLHGSKFLTGDFEQKDRLINEKAVRDSTNPNTPKPQNPKTPQHAGGNLFKYSHCSCGRLVWLL